MIVIPNLVDQRYSDLIAKLGASNDFVLIKTEDEISDKYEEGVIKSQSPEPGITARKGVTIVVTVSMGSADRELPVIAGQSIETAVRALNAQGFVASGVYMSSETVEAGKVIGYQSHSAGDKERYGSTVVIQISTGPEP